MITKDEALMIAGGQVMELDDDPPVPYGVNIESLTDCWTFWVKSPRLMIGGAEYIYVSKKDGSIVYHGVIGE